MLHLFLGLKSLVKVSRYHTDGSVFRLHYRVTVMALLAFTFIVTTRQYIGSPIMCVHTRDIPKDVLNTYCWIHPTYTLSSAHWKRVGVDVPHPGVDKTRDDRDKKHVKYYQWVGFCLFFQVGMCVNNKLQRQPQKLTHHSSRSRRSSRSSAALVLSSLFCVNVLGGVLPLRATLLVEIAQSSTGMGRKVNVVHFRGHF